MPEYVRLNIAHADFREGSPPFGTLLFDESRGAVLYGPRFHSGNFFEPPCEKDWLCFDLGSLAFAVPLKCEELEPDGSWAYGGRVFRNVGQINRSDARTERTRYAIDIFDEGGERKGVAIYSKHRGLESFAAAIPEDGSRHLEHYYLSSDLGAFRGGCVIADK